MHVKVFGSLSTRQIVALLMLVIVGVSARGAELRGTVVGVLDGDTIDVLTPGKDAVRVRLAGIDAPEKGQAFGNVAKSRLSDLVYGRDVRVEWQKKDKYGRIVGKVFVSRMDVDLEMVKSGLAWHYVKYAKEQTPADRTVYANTEADARRHNLGLWRDEHPVPPWDFRHPNGRERSSGAVGQTKLAPK